MVCMYPCPCACYQLQRLGLFTCCFEIPPPASISRRSKPSRPRVWLTSQRMLPTLNPSTTFTFLRHCIPKQLIEVKKLYPKGFSWVVRSGWRSAFIWKLEKFLDSTQEVSDISRALALKNHCRQLLTRSG